MIEDDRHLLNGSSVRRAEVVKPVALVPGDHRLPGAFSDQDHMLPGDV